MQLLSIYHCHHRKNVSHDLKWIVLTNMGLKIKLVNMAQQDRWSASFEVSALLETYTGWGKSEEGNSSMQNPPAQPLPGSR